MHHRLGRASEKKLPTSALSTSKLSSLSLHVEWHYSTNGNPNFQPCQMAILNTPNLIALSIHIQYTGKGQSGKVAILEFSTQRLLPPLEFLTLSGYAIGLGRPDELEHRIQVPALRVLNLTPGLGSNLFNFLATLMRSKQLRLEVVGIDGRALVFPSPVLHSWPAVFEAFLKHFKGLKELALKGAFVLPLPSLPVAEGISCHGETLEILILHHAVLVRGLPFQAFRRYRPRPIDVKNLCDTCPHLRKLTVDLHFGDVSRPGHEETQSI